MVRIIKTWPSDEGRADDQLAACWARGRTRPIRHIGRGGGGKGSEGEGDDCCDGSEYGGSGEVAAKMTAMAATQPGKMEAVACRALSVENAGIAGWGRGRT